MIDLKKYFTIGERIRLDYIDAVGQQHEYASQVVEIHKEEFIDVLIPIHKKRDVHLRQEALMKLILVKGEAIYEFKVVLHEKLFGRVPLLRLKVLAEVNKIQRRDFYRLKLMRDMEARLVLNAKEEKYSEVFKGNLHDISAGGLLFSSRKELQEKDLLELYLDLNGNKLTVFGTIVRRTLTDNYRAPYSYGVKYYGLRELERNAITKYIFEEQRKLIKKGLI